MKSIVYVGMDVHKETFSLCALDPSTGEILGETCCASQPKLVKKFIDHLAKNCDSDTTFQTGYEAGCLGYSLHNDLVHLGIDCVILAPTTMFNNAKHKMIKNDKMDARMIAQNMISNTYHTVYVPDQEDIEVKEYIRMRKDFKKALKKIKQQLGALLLRHGFHHLGTNWTQTHLKWIRSLKVSPRLKLVIDEYLIQLDELTDKINRYDDMIAKFSNEQRYQEAVGQLQCLKGIATASAMTLHVEISDFSRFPNARAFMGYLGLTPSEHSSGNHVNKGAMTKQGNSVVRTTLVECSRSLVKGNIGRKSKVLTKRQLGQPTSLIGYADKATAHLQRKYKRMIAQGKQDSVAIGAIARELAGFIWGIETNHIDFE